MTFKLGKHDKVVTAYAERASGPGWGNSPIWVIIRSNLDGAYRQECIQPAKVRLKAEGGEQLITNCNGFKLPAADGKIAVRDYLEAGGSKARLKRPKADTRPADSREGGLTHKGGHS